MGKFVALTLMACLLAGPSLAAQESQSSSQILKKRQKDEAKALKLQEKYAKQSLKSRNMPKVVRTQLKHQLASQKRALRLRQKEERQALKDRRRVMKRGMQQIGAE